MRVFVTSLILLSVSAAQGFAFQTSSTASAKLRGSWRVKFTMGGSQKNLVFNARGKGSGSFLLLDTGPDDKPVVGSLPAVWSQLTNDRVSFSGEVELPIGTCCREIGTLTFKGKFVSGNTLSGKLVFVTSVDEEESPYKLRSLVGTFTATRLPNE